MTQAMTAERRDFVRALEIAASVADKRSTIPILKTVKVTANGKLRLDATDLDTGAVIEMGYSGRAQGAFALRGAHQVLRALKQIGGEAVDLTLVDGDKGKRCSIASGALSATIATFHPDDWPEMEQIGAEEFGCDLGAAELAQIARVVPAISTEETRYYLNGIAFEKVGDWLWRFVATDGHRLMVVDVPLPGAEGDVSARSIIPHRYIAKVMQHFGKSKEPVRLRYGRSTLRNRPDGDLAPEANGGPRITFGGKVGNLHLTLTSKLIDGTYPDYTRVFPQGITASVRMNRVELLAAIRALTPLGNGRVRAVRLDALPDGVRVSLECPDLGGAHVDVAAEHGFGAGYKIAGFNGQYLIDCLNGFTGTEVDLQWCRDATPGEPCVIRDPADTAFFCVLMPMRV